MNEALVGKTYPPVTVTLAPERIADYAEAVGQRAPGVPPTIATVGEFAAFPLVIEDPDLGLDFARVVHGDQEYEWRRPFEPGETITVVARIAAIRQRGARAFLTIETRLLDADGALVVSARATMIERAA